MAGLNRPQNKQIIDPQTGRLALEWDAYFNRLERALDGKMPFADYTPQDILAKLLTVDGAGSGLDADKVDGVG